MAGGLAVGRENPPRNYRDVLVYFCRFCVRRGYIAKGTDWLENVQQYRARKIGVKSQLTNWDMRALLACAAKNFRRMVPFSPSERLPGYVTLKSPASNGSKLTLQMGSLKSFQLTDKSEERRRLVPVKANLKSWLARYRKEAGKVCPFINTTKQIFAPQGAKIEWKHNSLRHSCISYRAVECGDVARVSDESGNSPSVIRTNYLRRMKPAQAAGWFSIKPETKKKRRSRKLPKLLATAHF